VTRAAPDVADHVDDLGLRQAEGAPARDLVLGGEPEPLPGDVLGGVYACRDQDRVVLGVARARDSTTTYLLFSISIFLVERRLNVGWLRPLFSLSFFR